jgi:mycoredoxin
MSDKEITKPNNKITVYGTTWCGDCMRAKAFLDSSGYEYDFIDISEDESSLRKIMEINKGMQSVPTIQFPDGKVLVEPSNTQLSDEISFLKNNGFIHG